MHHVANGASVQIRIIAVGKVREPAVAALCDEFFKRIRPYYPLEIIEVKSSADADVRAEAERIIRRLHEDETVWLLDRRGTELSSEDFSAKVQEISNSGARRLCFIIAGAYGADTSLVRRAGMVWSLSKLTLLHEWARALLLEQIYRAAKIARNEPYHH